VTAALIAHAGHAGGPSFLTSWTLNPLQLVPIALVAVLYARRVRTLRHRGTPVSRTRVWLFGTGLALILVALVSPIDAFSGEQFLFVHMSQHLLIGDLAPLCLVLGLNGPILRPVLALPLVRHLQVLAHPLVALPMWTLNLMLWHVGLFYEGALHHDSLHALQHLLFLATGCVMWAPVFEVLPAPSWFGTGAKAAYVVVVRLFGTVLANVFIWSGEAFYPFYEHPTNRWGISARADQGIGGGIMMIEGSLVTAGVLVWLALRMAGESERRQSLLEAGLDPRTVGRAVRYGRAESLGPGE
jgi:cytochrome c oxidase assembly factor CtaG